MTDERAMRFGYLLGDRDDLQVDPRRNVNDIPEAMVRVAREADEAMLIAMEVSREALDKVVSEDDYMGDHDHGKHRDGPCPGCEREKREALDKMAGDRVCGWDENVLP
jgi:hypothetical protein